MRKPATSQHKPRSADANDIALGKAIRARRIEQKISQSDLGETLGVSFQQVQKYEKGINRVGATRLQQIATALETTVADLMGTPKGLSKATASLGMAFLATREGAEIAQAWPRLPASQHAIISRFVTDIAGTHLQAAE
jgi:transcriptional regulator with XRE-family HTH domain